MAIRKITQRAARQTKKQLNELQKKHAQLLSRYIADYPGYCVRKIELSDTGRDVLAVVGQLGFPIAAKLDGNTLKLYAVKP